MRFSLNRVTAVTAVCLWGVACASGNADDQATGTSTVPNANTTTGTAIATGTGTRIGVGTAPNTSTNSGVSTGTTTVTTPTTSTTTSTTTPPTGGTGGVPGGTGGVSGVGGSTTTGGKASTGGTTATTPTCTAATPVATWKSYAACGATVAAMETAYTTWRGTYFKECGSEAYVLKDDESPNVTVSEGIGYGMLITAALGKSADFAKLATFRKNRLDGNGLMNWKYPINCSTSPSGNNAATDADIDIALALMIADKAGFGGTYLADAKTLIGNIKKATIKPCSPGSLVMVGDQWGSCSQLNPSYFSPGHFHAFAKATGDTSWDSVASASYTLLAKYQSSYKGFVPDWGNDSGGGIADPNKGSNPVGLYGYEACRTPWRIALDYGWFQSAESKTFLSTFNTKVIAAAGGYPSGVVGNTSWKDNEKNSCHVGGYALVGTGIDQATADKYYANWTGAYLAGDKGTGAYYKATLKMLYMITAGGRMPSGL